MGHRCDCSFGTVNAKVGKTQRMEGGGVKIVKWREKNEYGSISPDSAFLCISLTVMELVHFAKDAMPGVGANKVIQKL